MEWRNLGWENSRPGQGEDVTLPPHPLIFIFFLATNSFFPCSFLLSSYHNNIICLPVCVAFLFCTHACVCSLPLTYPMKQGETDKHPPCTISTPASLPHLSSLTCIIHVIYIYMSCMSSLFSLKTKIYMYI